MIIRPKVKQTTINVHMKFTTLILLGLVIPVLLLLNIWKQPGYHKIKIPLLVDVPTIHYFAVVLLKIIAALKQLFTYNSYDCLVRYATFLFHMQD